MRFLQGTLDLSEQRKAQDSISLNEKVRLTEREYWESQEKALEASWREASGIEEPITDAAPEESADLVAQESTGDESATDDEEDDQRPDIARALLIESGRILADLINIIERESSPDGRLSSNVQ